MYRSQARCAWVLTSAGITVVRSGRRSPPQGGSGTSVALPTCTITPPRTRKPASSTTRPSPTTTRRAGEQPDGRGRDRGIRRLGVRAGRDAGHERGHHRPNGASADRSRGVRSSRLEHGFTSVVRGGARCWLPTGTQAQPVSSVSCVCHGGSIRPVLTRLAMSAVAPGRRAPARVRDVTRNGPTVTGRRPRAGLASRLGPYLFDHDAGRLVAPVISGPISGRRGSPPAPGSGASRARGPRRR